MRNVVVLLMAGAATLSAAQMDMAVAQKWGAAQVVRYEITGVFKGMTAIAKGSETFGEGDVSDSFTITVDWDVNGQKMVGKPTFTNTAATVGKLTAGSSPDCPPPVLKGPYDHFELTAVSQGAAGLDLVGTRSYANADVSMDTPATCKKRNVPAAKEAVKTFAAVASPVMLAMPNGSTPNIIIAADRKSFTIKHNDFDFTYKPMSVVR